MKTICRGASVFSQHPREAENRRMPDQFSAPRTTPLPGQLTNVQALKTAIRYPQGHFASQFTNPILHLSFHFIPPTALQGKHYWPSDTGWGRFVRPGKWQDQPMIQATLGWGGSEPDQGMSEEAMVLLR